MKNPLRFTSHKHCFCDTFMGFFGCSHKEKSLMKILQISLFVNKSSSNSIGVCIFLSELFLKNWNIWTTDIKTLVKVSQFPWLKWYAVLWSCVNCLLLKLRSQVIFHLWVHASHSTLYYIVYEKTPKTSRNTIYFCSDATLSSDTADAGDTQWDDTLRSCYCCCGEFGLGLFFSIPEPNGS